MNRNESLLKLALLYLGYFIYTYFGSYISSFFPFLHHHLVMLILDILFLIGIVYGYRKVLKEDFEALKKKYSWKKILKTIFLSFIGIIFINILIVIVGTIFHANTASDQNTESIKSLANISIIYTIFKTMIFGVVAEELLFRESLNKVVANDYLLVLFSAIIYTAMNFIFTSSNISLVQILAYFLPAILYSTVYIKNNRNIIIVMLVKFTYNLIPLALLLFGL